MSIIKRFFISMLGAIAGFWISIMLASVAFIVMIVAMIGKSAVSDSVSVKSNSILNINLSGEVVDRSTRPDIFAEIYGDGPRTLPLNDVVNALDNAADDKSIQAVLLDCNGVQAGMAQAQAIANAIDRFRQSGKKVIAYGDSYSQTDYFIACHADSIFLNPIGAVDIHGLASVTPFFKTLLDNIGAEMQVVKVGTYKSAVEPFILTDMSDASREQQQHYLGNIWGEMKQSMAKARGLKPEQFDNFADSFIVARDADIFVKEKLVNTLKYRHEMQQSLMNIVNVDKIDKLQLITPTEYCSATDLKVNKGKKNIAILYAVGDIVDGGDTGIVGDKMVREILDLADDDDIDGLILRVNSGGGSAFASEQIWEALVQYKKITGKPFYVSMGDYAASGGYYISCGADKIFAEPLTLTGSIGIFGLIPNIKGTLNDKLGINIATVETNPDASFPTIFRPMTEAQKVAMQGNVNRGYELFVSRVAKGRSLSVDAVKKIAEGRVWDGKSALGNGLVDELGGLDKTIEAMASALDTDLDDVCIHEYPDPSEKWWKELFSVSVAKLKLWTLEDELDPATMEIYRQVNSLQNMSTLQCRMPYFELK